MTTRVAWIAPTLEDERRLHDSQLAEPYQSLAVRLTTQAIVRAAELSSGRTAAIPHTPRDRSFAAATKMLLVSSPYR